MPRQQINPSEAGPTHGRYSKAVRTGNRVYVAGQVPVDAEGNLIGPGDIRDQAAATMRATDAVLQASGSSFGKMAMTRVYTTNVVHRDVLAQARLDNGLEQAPATLLEVNGLMNPYMLFEMSGIAYLDGAAKILAPDTVHKTGWPYSHGVQIDDTIYLSGQLGIDPGGNVVGPGNAEVQADQAAQNLIRLLEAAGGSAGDVVYTCLYITNPGHIEAVRAARRKYGLNGCPSTLVVIPSLATADFLVEIEAIAVIGTEKQVIRPDNVHSVTGRYEHAIVAGDTIYLAGQVGLDPDGNLVGPGDAEAQARQLFENMSQVLAAAGASIEDVVTTTTYMTNVQHREAVNKIRGEYGVVDAANTSVVISALAAPELLLEVEAIAVVGDR